MSYPRPIVETSYATSGEGSGWSTLEALRGKSPRWRMAITKKRNRRRDWIGGVEFYNDAQRSRFARCACGYYVASLPAGGRVIQLGRL